MCDAAVSFPLFFLEFLLFLQYTISGEAASIVNIPYICPYSCSFTKPLYCSQCLLSYVLQKDYLHDQNISIKIFIFYRKKSVGMYLKDVYVSSEILNT